MPTAPDLERLRAIYDEARSLLDGWSCEGSADCCRFGLTGREPYLWPIEWQFLAMARRGTRKRSLTVVGDCPLLGPDGKCSVYEARPFGCRTFFCERAEGPTRRPPRAALAELGRRIATLSERAQPGAGPRALTRWMGAAG
jgi:uncharacterized protein